MRLTGRRSGRLKLLRSRGHEAHDGDEKKEFLHVGEASGGSRYPRSRRCPSAWWTPPPSKRLERVIPVRRVRFPSTSANAAGVARVLANREERSDGSRPPPPTHQTVRSDGSDGEKVAGTGVGRRVTQLRHRARLDLTDALTREVEVLAHLFESAGFTTIETEA